jgi:glyoxylase-like metal-dependent hydrolase (beta-lactamase superfamily II)
MSRAAHVGAPARDWERPGAYEVAPGTYRIPLPLPGDALRAVNVYALLTGDGAVLVDSGWALEIAREQLEAALGGLGLDLGGITRFLVTHVHRDHYTQALLVRREFGSRIALGVGERSNLRALVAKAEEVPSDLAAKLRAAGATELVAALLREVEPTGNNTGDLWEPPDDWLTSGDAIAVGPRSLTVIETPGHTAGHVVFHDPAARLLFSGDHLLPRITPSVGFESVPARSPLRDYLTSLQVTLALEDARLLPAHGPVVESSRARSAELIAHHERRLDETLAVVSSGAATGFAVAARLLWTSRRRAFADLDQFNQMLAVNETIAHLDVLAEQGRITRTDDDGLISYVG